MNNNDSPSALRALQTAMQLERDGHAFYTRVAAEVADPSGRAMFLVLAQDELDHLTKLAAAYQSMVRTVRWSVGPLGKMKRPRIFPQSGQGKGRVAPATHELAAVERGIQVEKDSIAFYSQAAEETADPEGRAIYRYLVGQEEGHLAILQGQHDHLTRTGLWFGIPEMELEAPD